MSDTEGNKIVSGANIHRLRSRLLRRTRVLWEWTGDGLARTRLEKCPEDSVCPLARTNQCPHYPSQAPDPDRSGVREAVAHSREFVSNSKELVARNKELVARNKELVAQLQDAVSRQLAKYKESEVGNDFEDRSGRD